jgi:hypothetical protein
MQQYNKTPKLSSENLNLAELWIQISERDFE